MSGKMEDRFRQCRDLYSDPMQKIAEEKWSRKNSSNNNINNNDFMLKAMRRINGDPVEAGKRLLTWRFLFYAFVFLSFLLTAGLFNDLFYPVGERFMIQTHHPQVSTLSNAVEEIVVDESVVVRDLAVLPEHVLLLVKSCDRCVLAQKDEYECVYGDATRTPVISVDRKVPGLQIVRCPHPPEAKSVQGSVLTIYHKENGVAIPSSAVYSKKSSWEMLVYEAEVEEDSVIVFVKGLNLRRGRVSDTGNLACVYGWDLNTTTRLNGGVLKTRVLMAAQEVVRCEKPKGLDLQGMKISVWEARRGVLPSVARIDDHGVAMKNSEAARVSGPVHKVCACTMLWNQGAFLREWIMYHGYLGVDRWFLYDNNSDDDIEQVVESLESYNVSRYIWPWVKTQEAGFSHCALRAREECEWVMFMDVDEFLYPIEYIHNETAVSRDHHSHIGVPVLHRLIANATSESNLRRVGEIRIDCHSFGPSGLKKHPEAGVIAGYTCRLNMTERHKSIIRPAALNRSLLNVVHHFHLRQGYRYVNVPRGVAVFNHYKYQVWDTFKAKFFRRVATYVTDWQENQNEGSKDRAPGLGTEPIEPPDWSEKFCEISDTGLRNFTLDTLSDPETQLLPWQ